MRKGIDSGNGLWLDNDMSNTAPRILGISDEITTCDCCGRDSLKRTVHLEIAEGEDVYYGTTCAAHAFPKLGKGADIARTASKKCHCGCGEYGTIRTAAGTLWAPECWKNRKAAA